MIPHFMFRDVSPEGQKNSMLQAGLAMAFVFGGQQALAEFEILKESLEPDEEKQE